MKTAEFEPFLYTPGASSNKNHRSEIVSDNTSETSSLKTEIRTTDNTASGGSSDLLKGPGRLNTIREEADDVVEVVSRNYSTVDQDDSDLAHFGGKHLSGTLSNSSHHRKSTKIVKLVPSKKTPKRQNHNRSKEESKDVSRFSDRTVEASELEFEEDPSAAIRVDKNNNIVRNIIIDDTSSNAASIDINLLRVLP